MALSARKKKGKQLCALIKSSRNQLGFVKPGPFIVAVFPHSLPPQQGGEQLHCSIPDSCHRALSERYLVS